MIRPKMPAAWHTSAHHRALKYGETIPAAYDPLVDRLYVIEKVEQIFLSLRCLDERFHCSRIVIERIIAEAIKSGLVHYTGLKPLGTYEQRKALEEVMRTRYLLVVDSGEPGAEGSLGLLLKATGYPDGESHVGEYDLRSLVCLVSWAALSRSCIAWEMAWSETPLDTRS